MFGCPVVLPFEGIFACKRPPTARSTPLGNGKPVTRTVTTGVEITVGGRLQAKGFGRTFSGTSGRQASPLPENGKWETWPRGQEMGALGKIIQRLSTEPC